MDLAVRLLGADDLPLVSDAEAEVFDSAVLLDQAAAFLADPRHHIIGAIVDGRLVGFVSGVVCLHPDKAPELFVMELGVAPRLQRRGIGRALLAAMLAHDPPHDEQPEPRAAAFGREIRLENPAQIFRRNAAACVGEADLDMGLVAIRPNAQNPAPFHRFETVLDRDVEDSLPPPEIVPASFACLSGHGSTRISTDPKGRAPGPRKTFHIARAYPCSSV